MLRRLAVFLLAALASCGGVRLAFAQLAPGQGMYREDSAAADGHWGVFGLVVRKDVAAAICGTDGDYCPLQVNSTGALRIDTEAAVSTLAADNLVPTSGLEVGAYLLGLNSFGSWDRLRGDQFTGLLVDVSRLPNEGQQTMANSVSVAIASNQSAVAVSGPLTDAELRASMVQVDTEAGTIGTLNDSISPSTPLEVGAYMLLSDELGFGTWLRANGDATNGMNVDVTRLPNEGQQTMANSISVAIASNQSAVPASQSGTWNITNVSGTVSLPTGAATSANQSTEITALQLIDNLPNTIGSTTSGQSGALVLGAVTTSAPSYTTAQSHPLSLDTTGALRVTGGGGGTQYAEDSAHSSGDTATMAGVVQQSADAALSSDGDRSLLQVDANGYLKVNVKAGAGSGGTAAADDSAFTLGTTNVTVAGCVEATDSMDAGDLGGVKCGADRELDIDVVSSTLPTGASTLAEQQTQTTALQLIDDIVRSEDAASADGHAGAVILAKRDDTPGNTSGTDGDYEPLQVSAGRLWASATIDAAIPAGDNDIGNVDLEFAGTAAATNNGTASAQTQRVTLASDSTGNVATIGTSVTPGTSAAHLGKAVDAVAGATDTGVLLLAVRDDSLATLTPADGDYTQLRVNNQGALHVTGAGGGTQYNEADTDASITGTAILWEDTSDTLRAVSAAKPLPVDIVSVTAAGNADNSTFTGGTTEVTPMGAIYDTTPPTITDGNVGAPRMSSTRVLLVDGSGATQPVSGTVTVTGVATLAEQQTQTTALQLIDDIVRSEDVASADGHAGAVILAKRDDTPGNTSGTDGDYEPLQVSAGRLWASATIDAAIPAGDNDIGNVDLEFAGTAAATNNGSASAQTQRVTIASDSTGNIATIGTSVTPGTAAANLGKAEDAAAASADTGVAHLVVREDTPTSTAGSNGDYIAAKANLWGHQFTTSMCQDPNLVTSAVISTASSGNVELVALSSTQVIYVCGYSVVVTGAVAVQWIYGTGTACATGETNLTGAMPFAANAGISVPNGGAPQFKTAASNALCIELSAAVQVDGVVTYVKF